MSDEEESQEVDSIPPKVMRKGDIVYLVKDLLKKDNQAKEKSKNKVIEWGDESDEEDERHLGQTLDKGKEIEMEKDQKVFLDVISLSKRIVWNIFPIIV